MKLVPCNNIERHHCFQQSVLVIKHGNQVIPFLIFNSVYFSFRDFGKKYNNYEKFLNILNSKF